MDKGAGSYRRFLGGDDDGLIEIIKDYKDGLMLYINRFVGNIHIAEDLMEDTFAKVAIKKPRFSGSCSFKTWLYAIGRNVTVDYIRKHSKFSEIFVEDSAVVLSEEKDLLEAYFKDEQKIILHNALKKLNPDYSRVLYLIYFEDFSIKETATIIKKSYKQTENLIYRAKKSLKSKLQTEGFNYEGL